LTAIVALIVFFSVFLFGNPHFMRLFFTLLVGVSTYEIAHMLIPRIYDRFSDGQISMPGWWVPLIVGLACVLYAGSAYTSRYGLGVMMVGLLGAILIGIFLVDRIDLSFGLSSGILLCLVYGSFPWLAIWELYQLASDPRYIYFMCAIVWCGDTGAYFAGRAFGRYKLAPKMSPNKTWEGAVGGLFASIIGGAVLKVTYDPDFVSWTIVIVSSLLGGAFGQLGDLAESTFKRFSGVKDSGRIFPGHGGFLDRVDGLLFAAPVIWIILYQFGV
ncbi:MAG: phosphatidate cytidylyltransferase, partial [Oligoflexus sp.]